MPTKEFVLSAIVTATVLAYKARSSEFSVTVIVNEKFIVGVVDVDAMVIECT